jgi:class 3 adenylate cyclase/tetratricopeptide (TPR) repeat protein
MTFEEILNQAVALLQRQGRVAYRALKRQFNLDDASFEDLKEALLYAHAHVVDDGRGLVWTGEARPTSTAGSPSAVDEARAPLTYTPPYLAEKILTSRSALEGERKQVTVMFADLKGSMELLANRDPEDARAILDPVLTLMMDAVHRYEGTVNQVMGDGIMALFGAPIAHEDHAARACYAALAMQASVKAYAAQVQRTTGVPLQIRVGLNAGEVVVRSIGSDLHMDYTAVGQTTHLAARMEQMAMPGSILVTPEVCQLAEGYIQVKSLGPVPIKGMTAPVEVSEVTGTGPARTRLQATAARGLTRFVGRDAELHSLHQALQQAGVGRGQVVAAIGEAGVGKSRLLAEFLHAPHTEGWLVLASASVSYGKATPYFPVLGLLRHYCHVEEHDDSRTVRAKVTGQVLTLDESLQETIPALLALLDALPPGSPFLQLDPPQRCQRTLEALKRVLLRESQRQPLLLVFEDLHWIDAETQAVLDSLLESLPTAHLLLLVNYRPEYQHGWGSKTYYTQLRLDPLPPASASEVLQALLGDDPSLAPLKPLLIERSEGNPFFLEESVRTLVETRVLVGEPGGNHQAQALPTIQIPATVQAVLAARIDRLPPADKRLLQTAAVIGLEVPLPLLQALADLPEADLHRGLDHLQAAEFLYEARLFPERAFTFRHALTQEVAYGSLLHERRRVLHARSLEALEPLAAARLDEHVDRLAYHAVRGEVWYKAMIYGARAAGRAYDRAAFRAAALWGEQALDALGHLPLTPDAVGLAIALRVDLVEGALVLLGEYGRSVALLREAEAMARKLDNRYWLGQVLSTMSLIRRGQGDLKGAMAAGRQALELAATVGEPTLQAQASYHLGLVHQAIGDYGRAAVLFRGNVEARDPGTGRAVRPYQIVSLAELANTLNRLGGFSADTRYRRHGRMARHYQIISLACLANTLSHLGQFSEGRRHGEEALRLATVEGRGTPPMIAHGCLGQLYLEQGDLAAAIRVLEQGLALCRAADDWDTGTVIAALLGYACALAGRLAEGRALLEEALRENFRMGALRSQSLNVARLSAVCLLEGRVDEAKQHARRALDLAQRHGERGFEALALCQLSAVHAQADSPDMPQSEARYREALALAEALGMRPLQAHCHCGLGTLYAKLGQREQAHAELSEAIALYRAMDMTFWLPEAEAALAQVEGR